ncbi:heparan-alpha-glucosaminide N-acetyltransferase-like [Lineus longissimus]|uniref:heparan-alpha-glucosaminide N-acetyltransferase-like n=1 Tax=Lineus longissimus TaxID=88925 RepID=UPI002B4DEC9D
MEMFTNRKVILILILTVINTLDQTSSSTLEYEPRAAGRDDHVDTFLRHHLHNDSSSPKVVAKIDTAILTISSKLLQNISVMTRSEECYSCEYMEVANFEGNHSILVNTTFLTHMKIKIKNASYGWQSICYNKFHFMETGKYVFFVSKNTSEDSQTFMCVGVTIGQPLDNNIPIFIAIAILILLAICWILLKVIIRRHYVYNIFFCMETERLVNNDLGSPGGPSSLTSSDHSIAPPDNKAIIPNPRAQPRQRLKSLDTFRGVSIVVMIFVNYGGGGYWFFRHSSWNGVTVADLVFPWFIFIMGTSMSFAMKRPLMYKTPKTKIFLGILRRSLILFFLGIVLNTGPKGTHLENLRVLGVLQRFGITYFVVATVHMFFARIDDGVTNRWWSPIRDIGRYLPEWLLHLGLLAAYLALTFCLEVPGCPRGYLGPGGIAENGTNFNCTGGAAGYIDRTIFSNAHMYGHPTCARVYYNTVPIDPEGLLGYLTSIFLCFLGLQAGKILVTYPCYKSRLLRFLIWGLLLGAIGTTLCKGTKNEGWIPLNKNLWSVSFILCMAGLAFISLAFCYYTIDVQRWWSGAPFFYPGMNSILLYLCHEIFRDYFPVSFWVPDTHPARLAMNLWSTVFWVIVSVYLHSQKIFLSL